VATDQDGTVRHWNAVAARLSGWTAAEAVGRPVTELIVAEDPGLSAATVLERLRSGSPWAGHVTVRRKDGTQSSALIANATLRDGEQTLTGIVVLTVDATSPLWPFLGRSNDAAVIVDSDGELLFASPAVARLLGWGRAELAVTHVVAAPGAGPEEPPGQFLARAAAVPRPRVTIEARVTRQDGIWMWVEAGLTDRFEDADGSGALWRLRDVTSRRHGDDEVRTRSAQLENALTSRVVIGQAKGFLAGTHGITPEAGSSCCAAMPEAQDGTPST
jgi:PAS domain S-box-containing protein